MNNASNNKCIKNDNSADNTIVNNSTINNGPSISATTSDSSGISSPSTNKNSFLKFDTNKPRFDLIDPWFEEDVAKVLTMGAAKYAENNWKLNTDINRYIGALQRHLNEIKKAAVVSAESSQRSSHIANTAKFFDLESGLQHTAHIACNAMFLHYMIRKELNAKRKRK